MLNDYSQHIGKKFRTKDRQSINANVIYTVSGASADHNFGMIVGRHDAVHFVDKGSVTTDQFDKDFEPAPPLVILPDGTKG